MLSKKKIIAEGLIGQPITALPVVSRVSPNPLVKGISFAWVGKPMESIAVGCQHINRLDQAKAPPQKSVSFVETRHQ